MIIEGKKINLRKLKASDAKSIAKHANLKAIARFLRNSFPSPYTVQEAEKWIRNTQLKWRQAKEYHLGLEDPETGEIIGMIGLIKLDQDRGRAEVGYWLGKKYWRKGIMSEAVLLMLGFAFSRLKLNKVYAKVFLANQASAKLLEKVGFVKEGTLRKEFYKDGKWSDALFYGMLKEEFKS